MTAEFGSTAQPGALFLDLTSLIDQDFNASTMRIIPTPSTTIGQSPTSVPREKPDGRSGRIHIADGPVATNKFKKIWSAINTPRTKRAKTKKNKLTTEKKNYRKNVFAKMEGYFMLCQVMRGVEQTIGKKTDAGDNLLMTVNATIHDAAVYLDQPTQGEAKSSDNVQVMKTALLKHAFAISLWLEFIRDGKPAEQHNSAELGAMKKELNRRIADSHLFGGEETKDWLADSGAKLRSLLGIGDDADNFIDELRDFIYPLADQERLDEYSENRRNLKDKFGLEQRPSKEGGGSNFIFQDKGES